MSGPLEVPCPACLSKSWEPCTAPTNTGRRYVKWFHTIREDRAKGVTP